MGGQRLNRLFFIAMMIVVLILSVFGCQNSSSTSEEAAGSSTVPGSGNSPENASSSNQADGEEIKIGFISSSTGLASSQGKPEMDVARLMEEKINAEGGINGRPVKIIAYDDESDETKAVLAIKKLITQDNVPIVVGGTTTGNSLAMLEVAQSEKVPYISMAAATEIVQPVKEWVFKTAQNSDLMIKSTLEFLRENNITKVAWMHINDAYGEDGYKFFLKMSPDYGVEIVAVETFNGSDTDMTAQLSKIKLKNPQALVVWTRPPSGSVLTKNFRQLGFDIPLIHSYGMANQAFLDQAGTFANGVIMAGGKFLVKDSLPDSDPQKELLMEFTKEYKDKFGYEPTNFSGYAYDGIALAVEAIKNVGTDRAKIRDYLENNIKDFIGITGVFSFSPQDHSGLGEDSVAMIEIKDGRWAPYEK
mgnify:FL=1